MGRASQETEMLSGPGVRLRPVTGGGGGGFLSVGNSAAAVKSCDEKRRQCECEAKYKSVSYE